MAQHLAHESVHGAEPELGAEGQQVTEGEGINALETGEIIPDKEPLAEHRPCESEVLHTQFDPLAERAAADDGVTENTEMAETDLATGSKADSRVCGQTGYVLEDDQFLPQGDARLSIGE